MKEQVSIFVFLEKNVVMGTSSVLGNVWLELVKHFQGCAEGGMQFKAFFKKKKVGTEESPIACM